MKKIIFLLVSSVFLISNVSSYVPAETMFKHTQISHEKRSDGSLSKVLKINDTTQFVEKVVRNKRPVIVKVINGKGNDVIAHTYQDLAEDFKKDVNFVSINMKENSKLISSMMLKLGIQQARLPLFMFFKNGQLLLPLFSGFDGKEKFESLINEKFINKSSAIPKKNLLQTTDQQTSDTSSTWQKMENFGEKLKKWMFGLQNISNEMKSYQLSKRWRNIPLFPNSNV